MHHSRTKPNTLCRCNNCYRSLRTCYQSITCCFTAAVNTRRTDAVAAGQRTVAYQSGRGQREKMLCRRELITIVTPLSRPGSAKTAASVCLYSVYRKQERPLFTAALEQTSNVPSSRVRGRACGLPYPASGWRSRPSVTLHVCVLTGAPRRRRRGRMMAVGTFDVCSNAAVNSGLFLFPIYTVEAD